MPDSQQMALCQHCKAELSSPYCSQCGHPSTLKRINGAYIFSEIVSVLNFDKGILYTIKELLIRPGQNIQDFLLKDRNRLVKPVIFVILCSLIYTLAQQLLHFEDRYANYMDYNESAVILILEWIQKNYGYANIIMTLFIAIWIRIFFRKSHYNFFEILVLLFFIIGIGMLIYTIFGIVDSWANIRVLHFGGFIAFFYAAWAIGQFFGRTKKVNYLKGFLSYILGMISMFLLVIIIGVLIDSL